MSYDVIVLGSGPAGFYFAKAAANYNKKVLLIENDLLGGTGFRTGCLPVKTYLDGLRRARAVEMANQEDWCKAKVDRSILYQSLNKKIETIEAFMMAQLTAKNIEFLYGDPIFESAKTISLDGQRYTAEHIVIATGTRTNALANCKIDERSILSHKGMVALKTLPSSVIIIGGNVEGIEFASYLCGFGVSVTILALGEELLEGTDVDLSRDSIQFIRDHGGEIHLESAVKSIEVIDDHVRLLLENGKFLEGDKVLITGARSANIPNGLSTLYPALKQGCLSVTDTYESSIDGIYAIGDVNGRHGMAHIAIQQAIQLADYLYRGILPSQNYDSLPRSIFTINEIAGAGLQENACRALGMTYYVKEATFDQSFRGWSKGLSSGKIKIIFNQEDYVMGAWMTGESASDYIGLIGLWIDKKVSLEEIKASLFIHPSVGEGIIDAIIN